MKRKILSLFAAIGMICSGIAIGAEPFKDEVLEVTFPEKIGKLRLKRQQMYQEQGLGYSMRYEDEHLFKVDVYIYDKNLPDIGVGSNSMRVTDEFASVIKVFSMMEQTGKYKDVKNLDQGTTAHPQGSLQFLWHRCQYRQSAGEGVAYLGVRVSETYLSAKSGKFVKVRITLTEQEFKERQSEISGFVKHFATILGSHHSARGDTRGRAPQP